MSENQSVSWTEDDLMLRFTDTDKWLQGWFRDLPINQKIAYVFVSDNCNNAGFYEIDFANIAYFTGLSKDAAQEAILELFMCGAFDLNDGWIWIRDFIKQQKNYPINTSIGAHRQIKRFIEDQADRFPEAMKLLEEKVTKKKEYKKIPFDDFWNAYDKKVGNKSKIKTKWEKLSLRKQKLAMEFIERYKAFQPEKKYRLHPQTFLNGERWNDELYDNNPVSNTQQKHKEEIPLSETIYKEL